MSGPLGSSQWMYSTGAGGFYPYEIEQSLRFNDDDSAYLSRTPASAGNRKTWTWSGWVKRGNLGSFQTLFGGGAGSPAYDGFRFTNTDQLQFFQEGATAGANRTTTAVFRDTSAWYHIVLKLNSTASEVAIFVNGVEQTCTGAFPTNTDRNINNNVLHTLGRDAVSVAFYFDGYMAEVNFIDGSALDPTSFGEFKSGIWVPKAYSGSYGTNGFYLTFEDSAAIGDDLSGNANDWTPSGLASTDVMLDSPTNNYCVLNPLYKNSTMILSDGNLRANGGAATYPLAGTMVFPDEGKWYAEFTVVSRDAGGFPQFGLVDLSTNFNSNIPLHATKGVAYSQNGNVYRDGVSVSTGAGTFTTNDVIGVAYDATTREVWFSKNNVWVLSGDPAAGTSPAVTANAPVSGYAFGVSAYNAANVACNFGQSPFAYTPPDGFLPLNTANLPNPVINPAVDDVPADYFNTVLWTGTGAAQSITGVGFQPDWTWIKSRGAGAESHQIYDAIRGATINLSSDTTGADNTNATRLTSFDADGFSLGTGAGVNTNTYTYVAWNWLAGNGTSSNTDGSITSTVSVNQKAGFSIVSYTGTGANATVGHGLGVAPKMLLVKNRDQADDWQVYHGANTANPETDYLVLNTTAATADAADRWNDTLPTATVFSIGTGVAVNTNTEDYIAYCFAEVEGFSKFGSYTGNGSADGIFVYCGFRPAVIMVKRTNTTGNWTILDSGREGYNVDNDPLYPNLSNAEGTADLADLLSNGFKLRSTDASVNASGGTYIFAAFAEAPFKYANAR